MPTSHPTALQVTSEIAHHNRHRKALLDAIPDLDDQTLADTLEGVSDLNEMIGEVLRSALFDEALIVGLKARIQDMRARLERLSERAKTKRTLASRAMQEANLQRLEAPEFTAFLRKAGVKLEIDDEQKIPNQYWSPQPPKLDRQALIQTLKTDQPVPGACLIEGGIQLSVRTK